MPMIRTMLALSTALAALGVPVAGAQAQRPGPGLSVAPVPGAASLAEFPPAAEGDAARALRAAFDSLPPAGGRIDVPPGLQVWKTCVSLPGKSVDAGLGSTVFSVQAPGCDALTIAVPDEAHSVVLRDLTMQAVHGVAVGTAITVNVPSDNDPKTHAKTTSVQTKALLAENLQLISPNTDPSASFNGGLAMSGVWNALIRNVQASCRMGQPTPGSFGFRYGQAINTLLAFDSAVACDVGIEQVDYSEGTEIRRASLIGSNVSIRVNTTPNLVNGMVLDQLVIEGAELTGYVAAGQVLGPVAEGFVHDSHLLLLADQNAVGAADALIQADGRLIP